MKFDFPTLTDETHWRMLKEATERVDDASVMNRDSGLELRVEGIQPVKSYNDVRRQIDMIESDAESTTNKQFASEIKAEMDAKFE